MELEQLQKHWDAFGRTDPLWAILTTPDRRGGRWDLEAFLRTGEEELAAVLEQLATRSIHHPHATALDFGCGVGRLTQALCTRFDETHGVDIASTMIDRARELNRHGDRCLYHVNDSADLSLFSSGTFDFVLSIIVLQHMEPRHSTNYIREFVRLLSPEGVAVFQVPYAHEPTELPAESWRAAIDLNSHLPELTAGDRHTIDVAVRNISNGTWPLAANLRVGNHWLDASGMIVANDDGRTPLSVELAPQQETTVPLSITAPSAGGRYQLELDMVQESVGWFGGRGSPTLRLPLRVRRKERWTRRKGGAEETGDAAPVMEMHCVPRDEIASQVETAGGEIVGTFDRDVCGGGYRSLHYIVKRSSERGVGA